MKRSLEFGSGSLDSYVPFEFLKQTPTTSKAAPAIRVLFFASAEKSGRIGTDNLLPGGRSVAHNVFISSGSTKTDRLSEAGLITSVRRFEGNYKSIRDDITDGCCCGVTGVADPAGNALFFAMM